MTVRPSTYSLECEADWALGSITRSKAGGGDGTAAELFQSRRDDAAPLLQPLREKVWGLSSGHEAGEGRLPL